MTKNSCVIFNNAHEKYVNSSRSYFSVESLTLSSQCASIGQQVSQFVHFMIDEFLPYDSVALLNNSKPPGE